MLSTSKSSHAPLALDVAEVDAAVGKGWNLPAQLYVDPAVLALEERAIFRRAWQIVGTERDVQNAGDFITTTVSGVPVVVSRAPDSKINAMVNVCRHRGKIVATEPRGNCDHFRCLYHAWNYDLDGTFMSAPSARSGGLPSGELLGLHPIAVDVWLGLVFVCLEPVESLLAFLGELPQVMEELGSPFDFGLSTDLEFTSDVTVEMRANWKEWVENNHECYHCASVHPTTLSEVFCLDVQRFQTRTYHKGMHLSAPFQAKYGSLFEGRDEAPSAKFRDLEQYYIWPNMFFSTTAGHGDAFFRIDPDGPDQCRVVTWAYSHSSTGKLDPDTKALMDVAFDEVVQEDIVMSEQAHAGLKSGFYQSGPLVRGREDLILYFQRMYWDALRPHVEEELRAATGPIGTPSAR